MTTLLVVDDSATDRRLVGELLEKKPRWKVVYAVDGRDALRQLELHVPDLVLTGLQMPQMNTLEFVNAAKRDHPLIPVVLMTARGSEEIAVQALKQGAASYVSKSRLAADLVEIVELVLLASHEKHNHSRLMPCLTRTDAEFVLDNDMSLFPAVVNYLQQLMARVRVCGESERLRVGVALEEALLNAFYHGNLEVRSELREADHKAYYDLAKQRCHEEPYRDRRIYISAKISPSETVYVVRDEGPGFDPADLPDATDSANIERPCGRGLLLMRTFMDEVLFNDVGNEVTLIKRRVPENVEVLVSETS